MSGKRAKLLRKGAAKFNLPISRVKLVFKNATPEAKRAFVENARQLLPTLK